jgi:hypothetical protein
MRRLESVVQDVQAFLSDADPKLVTPGRAAELIDTFSTLERLGAAGTVLFASRAADSQRWAQDGHRSPGSWIADKQKSSLGNGTSVMETSKRLENLDQTREHLRTGDLSFSQAKEIALAAEHDPKAERALIEAAGHETLNGLRQRVRDVMARASSEQEEIDRYNRIRSSRYLRKWNDYDGAIRIDAKLAPDCGARVMSVITAEADAIFEKRRAEGDTEDPQRYAADALVALMTGDSITGLTGRVRSRGGPGSKRGHDRNTPGTRTDTVVVRVDADSLRRGYVKGEELCEISGVGRVPVATARSALPEAFLKIVIRDSVDVLSVCHVGRLVSAHLRSALEERDPCCVVPGCDVAHGLEIHHWREDYAKSKVTSLDAVCRLCARHHDLVTYGGFGLDGGPGKWDLIPPPRPSVLDSS